MPTPAPGKAVRRIRPPPARKDSALRGGLRGRIKVVVRKRPLAPGEPGDDAVTCALGREVRMSEERKRLDLSVYRELHTFAFDAAFGHDASTDDVYRATACGLLDTFTQGGNASCFAYGQTGSGKTHTMLGDGENAGLYLLTARELFERIDARRVEVRVSLFEIYCEKLYDLVEGRKQVFAREGADGVVKICGLSENVCRTARDVIKLVDASSRYRSSGATAANARSSRSHAILRISLRGAGAAAEACHFSFVDLAGSERGADTAERDLKTRREGCEINKSLLALKECIRGLDMGHKHVKFRGSKLTEVLRQSFTGNCRTCMVATVSPSSKDVEHSMNTLRYAHRVKALPPVKVSQEQRRLTPPSKPLPRVVAAAAAAAAAADGPARPRRVAVLGRLRAARHGACQHCGSSQHHTLLCRKPQRLRAGGGGTPASASASSSGAEGAGGLRAAAAALPRPRPPPMRRPRAAAAAAAAPPGGAGGRPARKRRRKDSGLSLSGFSLDAWL